MGFRGLETDVTTPTCLQENGAVQLVVVLQFTSVINQPEPRSLLANQQLELMGVTVTS